MHRSRPGAAPPDPLQKVSTWWIMRDPSGQPFCVVRPQTADFPGDAATWP